VRPGTELVPLSELITPVWREVRVDAGSEYRVLGVRWYGQGLFQKGTKTGQQIKATKLYRVHAEDFIYNRLFAWKGSFAVVGEEFSDCYVSNEFPCFEIRRDRLDAKFLLWYFRREAAWAEALGLSSGATPTSRNRLKEKHLLALRLPLPPLEEQLRVVAAIEQLSRQSDEARRLRAKADQETQLLWPSILAEVLVGKGRRCRGISEDARELLEEAARRHAGSRLPEHNNAHPHLPVIVEPGPSALPTGWVWTTLGSVVTHLVDCVNDTPNFADRDTGFIGLKTTNVRPYHLDLSRRWFVDRDDFKHWNRREEPQAGDIILTREAPMGYACSLPSGYHVCLTQRLMLLRPDTATILPEFLLHYLNSPHFRGQVNGRSRGLTTPHIRVQDAPDFALPLPPMEEQWQIVSELRVLQGEVDELRRLQAGNAAEFEAVLPAILQKAFSER
jgi:type I restriction enzyme, S subunit